MLSVQAWTLTRPTRHSAVLPVVFLPLDARALHILGVFHSRRFLRRHYAISFDPALKLTDMLLAMRQPVRFRCGQLTTGNAFGNAGTLVLLPFINTISRQRRGGSKQQQGRHQTGTQVHHDSLA